MINHHKNLFLDEQKYVGIKTTILFNEHDNTDFFTLHKNLLESNISNINYNECFMALDTDFTKESFTYTPLVPVNSFNKNDSYTKFTREGGIYYAFEISQKECNPAWFKKVFKYMEENNLTIKQPGYDLEYYENDYFNRINKKEFKIEEEVYMILFKSKNDDGNGSQAYGGITK